MRDGQPSQTARLVAAYRLGFERVAAPFGDPESDDLLAGDVSAGIEIVPNEPMARYLQHRTAFFDRVVVNGLERGCTQVVVVGAGYDGRALRYTHAGVRWFEVDHPATQADKRERLSRLGVAAPNVTFVAADLTVDDVADGLIGAGFVPDAPSLLLCEGLAVYLSPAVLARLLGQLRSIATAGTRLALSASIAGADPARRERFAARVAEMGEPLASTGADTAEALDSARWRSVELSERAQRSGLIVGVPVWEPGAPGTRSEIGAYLERTFHRSGLDRLGEHLHGTYGITVTGTRRLDAGVVQVQRADGPPWVARVFPAERPAGATNHDAQALRHLTEIGYPAERLADAQPISVHEGQAVLVTEHVDGKAPRPTQQTFRQLGELLGRLHAPAFAPGAQDWPGGGWHHLAPGGGPEAEVGALRKLFDARRRIPESRQADLAALRRDVDQLDDLHDLPQAFTHPDFVPANALIGADGNPVIVDWTGAGRGPRLWTLGFLLWTAGQSGPKHVDAVAAGYLTHIRLDPAELARLEPAIAARPIIFGIWVYATGRRPLADVAAHRSQIRDQVRDIAIRARQAFKQP